MEYEKELAVAQGIAKKAGVIMREYFRADQHEIKKDDGTPVTIADTAINRMAIEELQKHFDDVIIGEEESTGGYGMGRRWLCDPIDGTKAYTWGVPTAMFSLGLVVDGVATLGVAYDPFLDQLFYGVRGQGSFCNDVPLHVSQKNLTEGYVAVTSRVDKLIENREQLERLRADGARLAAFSGSVYKMCQVARGAFVGYFEEGINAYDTAAGHVIVEEAGGTVTGLEAQALDYSAPLKGAVFSNGIVHDQLVASAA